MAENCINGLNLCQGAIEGIFTGDADVAEHCENLLVQPWFPTDMRNKAAPHAPALYAVGKARRSAAVKGSAAATSSATTSSAATSSHRDDDDDDDDDGEESVEYLLVGKATYDLFNTLKEVFSPRADDVLSVELRSSADSDLRLKWSTVEWRSAARVPLEGCQEYVSDRLGYRPRFDHLIVKRDACTVS